MTEVKVFEGIVEAKELITGEKVEILAGQISQIIKNQKPSEPVSIEDIEKKEEEGAAEEEKTEAEELDLREEARREMFEEISTVGMAGGIGFRLYGMGLDYTFAPFGQLGDTHRVTFIIGGRP